MIVLQVRQRVRAPRSEKDPFLASVRREALLVHPRDPYPYEFSYASGRYIFMAEFICWEPRGGQRLITPSRATPRRPLLFFLALFVFGDLRYALFIVVSMLEAAAYTHAAFLSVYRVCDI